MKKFSFDISWKGIILVLIILAFLLGVVDRVSAEEVPISHYNTTVKNRMYEFQTVENRLKKIREAEDDSWSGSWIRVYDAEKVDENRTLYKYRWYDGGYRRLIDRSIILSNELVDTLYQQHLILSTDSIYDQAVERICGYYIGR